MIVRVKRLLEQLRVLELRAAVHRAQPRHVLLHLATQLVELLHLALVARVVLLRLDLIHACDVHLLLERRLLLGRHLLPSLRDYAEDVALPRLIADLFPYLLESSRHYLAHRLHRAAVARVRAHGALRLSQSNAVLGLDSPVVHYGASLHIDLAVTIHVNSGVHVALAITPPPVGNDRPDGHFALDASLVRHHRVRLRMTPNRRGDLDESNARNVGAHQVLVVHRVGYSRVCVAIHGQPHGSARIVHHRVRRDAHGVCHRHLDRLVHYGLIGPSQPPTLNVAHIIRQNA